MGRTVGQQWYGGTERSLCDSLQFPPGLRGWEGLWDSSGMVGLRESLGLPSVPARTQGMGRTWDDSVLTVYLPGTPFSPQDSLLFLGT